MKITLPLYLLDYVNEKREQYSLPVYVIKCINYIRYHNITLEELDETTRQTQKKRKETNERDKGSINNRQTPT